MVGRGPYPDLHVRGMAEGTAARADRGLRGHAVAGARAVPRGHARVPVMLTAANFSRYAHPVAGWVVIAVMAVWTGITIAGYERARLRAWPTALADLAVTARACWPPGGRGPDRSGSRVPTLPVTWMVCPVLAVAVVKGPRWGVAAAVLIGACDLAVRGGSTQATLTGLVIMVHGRRRARATWATSRPGPRSRCAQRSGTRGRATPNGSGWPAASTTRCCRCWPWSSGGASRAGRARRPSWAGWPASRRRRCARWSARARIAGTPAGNGRPARTGRVARPRPGRPSSAPACRGVAAGAPSRTSWPRRSWRATRQRPAALPAGGPGLGAGRGRATTGHGDGARDGPGIAAGPAGPGRAARAGSAVAQSIRGRIRDLGGAASTITTRPGQGTEVELRSAAAASLAWTATEVARDRSGRAASSPAP